MKDWFHSSRLQIIIWAAKLLLLFIGIVSTFLLFKVAIVPHLTLSTFPQIWTSLRTFFLSPLYIYIIVNFIILAIAFSSTFQHQNHSNFNSPSYSYSNSNSNNFTSNDHNKPQENYQPIQFQQESPPKDNSITSLCLSTTDVTDKTISSHRFKPHQLSIQEQFVEKKPNLKDKSKERVLFSNSFSTDLDDKSAIEDSIEDTWRAIMEKQGKPKAKQLKKSETFGAAHRLVRATEEMDDDDDFDPVRWARRELNKSETFRDRMSVRRDKSMSQDELNRKVETFIKKFNNDIKLQRQESDQRFVEMINRSL